MVSHVLRKERKTKKRQTHHNQHHVTQFFDMFHTKSSVVRSMGCSSGTKSNCASARSCRTFAGACQSEEENRKQKTENRKQKNRKQKSQIHRNTHEASTTQRNIFDMLHTDTHTHTQRNTCWFTCGPHVVSQVCTREPCACIPKKT